MTVYVDPLMGWGGSKQFRWTKSCHMYADDVEELHRFAAKVGLKRAWFQADPRLPHYDLNKRRTLRALELGAVEVSMRDVAVHMKAIRLKEAKRRRD